MKETRYSGIDLFSGAGGLSLGAVNAGIDVKYAIEKDQFAAETYKVNHPQTIVINKDISLVSENELYLSTHPLILFGGPPCQGFSTSNRRTRNGENPKNWLYKEFVRFILFLAPEIIVFENVGGLVNIESGRFVKYIIQDFENLGYEVTVNLLNSADFGVPQYRKRLFIIGSKQGHRISIKIPTNPKLVTVKEAIYDLPILENGASIDLLPYSAGSASEYAYYLRGDLAQISGNLVTRSSDLIIERYKYINQGENWRAIPRELMHNYKDRTRCHTGIYYRLREDEPSKVIGNFRKNMLIHPTQNRGLSIREAARIQSFPDQFQFIGNLGLKQQQIGDAVPPLLAERVFNAILEV